GGGGESIGRDVRSTSPDGTRLAASCLAAAPEATFPDGITRLLALTEELHIRHDRLLRMVGSPMRDVGVVVGNADHQARRSSGPIDGRARRPPGAIEQVLQGRHRHLPRPSRPARVPPPPPAAWPAAPT